jgi:quinol monooxygenase YgiN
MTNTSEEADGPGFVSFWTVAAAGTDAARTLLSYFVGDLRHLVKALGLRSAQVHLDVDGTTVVVRSEWQGEDAHEAFWASDDGKRWREIGNRAEVTWTRTAGGVLLPRLDGPDKDSAPGVVVIATRHVGHRDNALRLAGLLERSGDWKRDFPGFVSAEAAISADGATFVNYPRWVDEESFRAYMTDPRNAARQPDIAGLEVAAPEIVRCAVVAEITNRAGTTERSGR